MIFDSMWICDDSCQAECLENAFGVGARGERNG